MNQTDLAHRIAEDTGLTRPLVERVLASLDRAPSPWPPGYWVRGPQREPEQPRPGEVVIADYEADPDTFVEPDAGEVLYRLR